MNKEILIVRTKAGHKYAEVIAEKIKGLGIEDCEIVCWKELDAFMAQKGCTPDKTLLHYRSTGPKIITPKAYELEKKGYKLINPAKVLDRTGDKFKSYEWAHQNGIIIPLTKKGTKAEIKHYIDQFALQKFILKPTNSIGGGAFCFQSFSDDPSLDDKLSQVPGEEIILQEFIEYVKIYRVIIIGDKVLDKAVFYDEPDSNRWKVSVCLNPEMKLDSNPDPKLLSYAKQLAEVFETEIAFIDIYETKDGYVLSEINTACSLLLHEEKSGCNISEDIAKYLISKSFSA
ncbi:hypothetical protein COY05_00145 [Candidatus Peregrinibacteria bacterium CG_4_10_14_0_2_um_filter_38_24]|nr:MAG: hypothetical protein COY05_00145 [Candidatus Peregrinibacteria bacterium CG_4_10_14_0_2_um_filter_38_24]